MAADNFLTNIVLDAAMMPDMSPREKALRDLFVREYLQDYDAIAACLRCGFMRSFATEYAVKFMEEPYVRQQIQLLETSISGGDDEEAIADHNRKRIYNALMREAHYHGPGSSSAARVAALSRLAVIEGMDKGAGKKDQLESNAKRGGVMRVPAIANMNEWEDVAFKTQEKLVQDARK